MVATFHREVVGGDRFYDLLARLEQDPSNNIEMLEFLYMCLSLGFEGRLRVEQNGCAPGTWKSASGLARLIRNQRGPVEREISPHVGPALRCRTRRIVDLETRCGSRSVDCGCGSDAGQFFWR